MLVKFVALLLLFVAVSVTACSSGGETSGDKTSTGEITAVVLTDSERGEYRLAKLTQNQLERLSMEKNPGHFMGDEYLIGTFESYSGLHFPEPESSYLAIYEKGNPLKINEIGYPEAATLSVITYVFNSETIDAALRTLYSSMSFASTEFALLNKGNIVVLLWLGDRVGISNDHSPSVADVAGSISQRFGMEIVEIDRVPEFCSVSDFFSCVNYSVTDGGMEIVLQNNAGEVEIREIIASSDLIEGSECGTGEIKRSLPDGSRNRFVLNKSSVGSACNYGEGWREKNRYTLKVSFVFLPRDRYINDLIEADGILVASGSPS